MRPIIIISRFKSKRVDKGKQKGRVALVGDLTIHEVTKEVVFDVTGAEAKARINRRDFGSPGIERSKQAESSSPMTSTSTSTSTSSSPRRLPESY